MDDPPIVITRPMAAQYLNTHIPEIMEAWEERVRAVTPALKDQSRTILQNSLPKFLERLADVLGHSEVQNEPIDAAFAQEHGEQRAQLEGYSLEQVIEEYYAFRLTLITLLQSLGPLDEPTNLTINASIDWSIKKAATEYMKTIQWQLQTAQQHQQEAEHQRNEALQTADQRKNEFIAVLAHEFRTPLSVIKNALYTMEAHETDPKALRSILASDRQVDRLTRMVEDLTDINRIITGKVELKVVPLDLNASLKEAIEVVHPFFEERRQELELAFSSEPLVIEGDQQRLDQVFTNLLKNASKFTPPNGKITVFTSREGGVAVLSFKDTGIGIDPAHVDDVFNLYTQLDTPESVSSDKGLGIGLSLVRRIVDLHGGTVTAKSEGIGHGSHFIVRLPLKRDD
jgi:signal transduction histidine kinase